MFTLPKERLFRRIAGVKGGGDDAAEDAARCAGSELTRDIADRSEKVAALTRELTDRDGRIAELEAKRRDGGPKPCRPTYLVDGVC